MAETLGQRIASLRHAAGLSQSQLAERAGISTGTLKNWEQGIRQPLPKGIAAIARGLGISPGPLLEGVVFDEESGQPQKASAEPATDKPTAGPGRPRKKPETAQTPPVEPAPEPSGEKPGKKPKKRKEK